MTYICIYMFVAAHKGCRSYIEITNSHLEITISALYLGFVHQREETYTLMHFHFVRLIVKVFLILFKGSMTEGYYQLQLESIVGLS